MAHQRIRIIGNRCVLYCNNENLIFGVASLSLIPKSFVSSVLVTWGTLLQNVKHAPSDCIAESGVSALFSSRLRRWRRKYGTIDKRVNRRTDERTAKDTQRQKQWPVYKNRLMAKRNPWAPKSEVLWKWWDRALADGMTLVLWVFRGVGLCTGGTRMRTTLAFYEENENGGPQWFSINFLSPLLIHFTCEETINL